MKNHLGFGVEFRLEWKWVWTLDEKGENEGRRLGGFVEREEIKPLGGCSKISEEDQPLWIGNSKIRIVGSKENLKTWEKPYFFIKLKSKYKMFHKGLYTIGQNTKKPNTTKRFDKAQTKILQKLQKDFLFYDLKLIWDLFWRY